MRYVIFLISFFLAGFAAQGFAREMTHIVRSGDTVVRLLRQNEFCPIFGANGALDRTRRANPGLDVNKIRIGAQIQLASDAAGKSEPAFSRLLNRSVSACSPTFEFEKRLETLEKPYLVYKIRKADTVSQVLMTLNLKPLWGSGGAIQEIIRLNPRLKQQRANLVRPHTWLVLPATELPPSNKYVVLESRQVLIQDTPRSQVARSAQPVTPDLDRQPTAQLEIEEDIPETPSLKLETELSWVELGQIASFQSSGSFFSPQLRWRPRLRLDETPFEMAAHLRLSYLALSVSRGAFLVTDLGVQFGWNFHGPFWVTAGAQFLHWWRVTQGPHESHVGWEVAMRMDFEKKLFGVVDYGRLSYQWVNTTLAPTHSLSWGLGVQF